MTNFPVWKDETCGGCGQLQDAEGKENEEVLLQRLPRVYAYGSRQPL